MPTEKGCGYMVRQCAWCLRLINNTGKRLSIFPVPKLYEASHGICGICGVEWMEQVIDAEKSAGMLRHPEQEVNATHEDVRTEIECQESMTRLLQQLQDHVPLSSTQPQSRRRRRIHI